MQNGIAFEMSILQDKFADFTAKFIAAKNIHEILLKNPQSAEIDTLLALEQLMYDRKIMHSRQSFFLFRETAGAIASTVSRGKSVLSNSGVEILRRLLRTASDASHRATSEITGSLPLSIPPVSLNNTPQKFVEQASLDTLLKSNNLKMKGKPTYQGRSLIIELEEKEKVLVIKCAKENERSHNLLRESLWLNYLHKINVPGNRRFDVPSPQKVQDHFLFYLQNHPVAPSIGIKLHAKGLAIAFVAHRDYFMYVNDFQQVKSFTQFSEALGRNSYLLGFLASHGMMHTAPIPLFHNRVQRNRRIDNGLYDWTRAGRLDQWLASCQYPNLGLSGLRDFEHLQIISKSGEKLYWHIGSHILSLILVASSYFRNICPGNVGTLQNGKPVDARNLFDANKLTELISSIFTSYYKGFTADEFTGEMPFDSVFLAGRIIEEMGVDNYMEEILRQADQKTMTDIEFINFLISRGFSPEKARSSVKGLQDISLQTGPHLGGFNQKISIPELVTATASMAATCVLGKFIKEQNQDGEMQSCKPA